jgi:hypothetical protein
METQEQNIPTLNLSENFYSIQGEGISSGVPAYFIRLKGCNFLCGGHNGSLVKEGKTTWWCDSEAVWRKGAITLFDNIMNDWRTRNIIEWVFSGRVHIVWTGGEPTISRNQRDIMNCIEYMDRWIATNSLYYNGNSDVKILQNCAFNEIETNGSIVISDDLFDRLQQINCSPKLANSGMKEDIRIVPDAINKIMKHHNYQFKFVVSTEADIQEIIRDFVTPFNIPGEHVVLMPGLDCQANFHERTRFVMEMAKKYGFIGLTRLHISCWDKTCGV